MAELPIFNDVNKPDKVQADKEKIDSKVQR